MKSVSVLTLLCLFPGVLCHTIFTGSPSTIGTTYSSIPTTTPFYTRTQEPYDDVNYVLSTYSISHIRSMSRLCRNSDVMCKYAGCGDGVDSDDRDYPCYCDHRCIAYGDCCYDFYDSCKEEVERSKVISYLKGVSVKCLDGSYVSVVDGCALKKNVNGDDLRPEDEDDDDDDDDDDAGDDNVMILENKEPTQRPQTQEVVENKEIIQQEDDFLNSLTFAVTDNFTGIHFVNYSIYKCNRLGRSRPIVRYRNWDWKYNISEENHSAVPSSNVRGRSCSKKLTGLSCYEFDESNGFSFYNEPDVFCYYFMAREGDSNYSAQFTIHGNGTNNEKDSALYNENIQCHVLSNEHTANKDVPINSNKLFTFDEDLQSLRITQPHSLPWTAVSCLQGTNPIENCHFQKCGDVYYAIGRSCLRFHSLTATLKYAKVAHEAQTHNFSGQIVNYVHDAMSIVNASHPYSKHNNLSTLGGGLTQTIEYIFDDKTKFTEPNSPLYVPFFNALLDSGKLSDLMVQSREMGIDILEVKVCANFIEKYYDKFMKVMKTIIGSRFDESNDFDNDFFVVFMDELVLDQPKLCDIVKPRHRRIAPFFDINKNSKSVPRLNFYNGLVVFGYVTTSLIKII